MWTHTSQFMVRCPGSGRCTNAGGCCHCGRRVEMTTAGAVEHFLTVPSPAPCTVTPPPWEYLFVGPNFEWCDDE